MDEHPQAEVEVEVVSKKVQVDRAKSALMCETHQDKMMGRNWRTHLKRERRELEDSEMETVLRKQARRPRQNWSRS